MNLCESITFPRFLREAFGCMAIRPATATRSHRRWQTMHNRWWSDSATCGERIPHYHSASKMSNNVVPLRGTLLLVPPLRRLRPCGLASGYAWFAISDGTSSRRSPSELRYAPTSRQGGASLADNLKNRINLCEPITHPQVLREYLHHFRGGRWA